MFKFSNKKVTIQLYYKDITYIARDTSERKVIISTTNNKFLIPLSIKECLTKLDYRFCLAHRACILNKTRVSKYNWNDKFFVLDNGEKVYLLSQKYKKEVLNNDSN
jgi:DNA-binding LytR/AlgR family response regulator